MAEMSERKPPKPQAGNPTRTTIEESAGPEIIRSEEQLVVDTEVRVSGRAVLRKYVVTETVTQTFQVRHEEVRLEQIPDTDLDTDPTPNRAPFEEVDIEIVLHREVPKVALEVVAVERVRLRTDTVTTQVPVAADVRKEQIVHDPDGDVPQTNLSR